MKTAAEMTDTEIRQYIAEHGLRYFITLTGTPAERDRQRRKLHRMAVHLHQTTGKTVFDPDAPAPAPDQPEQGKLL